MYYMGTVIAALVSALLPAVLISVGVVNRDKYDLKLRNAAEELGMDFEVWKIDKRRRKRISARVNRNKTTIVTQTLTWMSISLAIIANIIIWTPAIQALLNGEVDIQSLAVPLVIASVVFGLVGLAISWINLQYLKKKAESLLTDFDTPAKK
ncbi:hypothetical protein BA700_01295 [Corynebacterium stationis]|nr:hypothetical protein AW169_01295 [Corynebacterium stationis]AQX70143.1 hypothetical protein CA21670_00420 [Corynebacterium stationis]ASJ17847.1 hypothetical protein BA700_01295 [Corynebacterium stationis]